MNTPKRNHNAGTFLVTAATYHRRRLFQVTANCEAFLETLQRYRAQGLYKLHAFVLMPDHIHLLITTENLTKAMQHIKGGFSRRITSRIPIWQKGFADHLISGKEDFLACRNYLLQNPVRAGLSETLEAYPYSSAFKEGR